MKDVPFSGKWTLPGGHMWRKRPFAHEGNYTSYAEVVMSGGHAAQAGARYVGPLGIEWTATRPLIQGESVLAAKRIATGLLNTLRAAAESAR